VGILRGASVGPLTVLTGVALAFLAVAALAAAEDRAASARRRSTDPVVAADPPAGDGPSHAARQPVADPPRPIDTSPAEADPPRAPRRIPSGAIVLGILCAVAFMVEDAMVSWSALYLEGSLGAPPALGGAGPGIFSAAMFVGRWAGQPIGARFGERDILVGSGVLASIGIGVVAMAPSAPIALAGLGIAGAGISVAAPALFGRAGRLAGSASRGAAVSMLTTFGYMGFVIGPPLVGFVAGATDLRVSFAFLAAIALGYAVAARLTLPAPDDDVPHTSRVDASEPPVLRA
jgi:hypothetical protein